MITLGVFLGVFGVTTTSNSLLSGISCRILRRTLELEYVVGVILKRVYF